MDNQTNLSVKNNRLETMISIDIGKDIGLTAGVYVQEIARKLSQYNESVDCNDEGFDKKGEKILVNTAGKYLFGVPGCPGHIRIVSLDKKISIYFSSQAPVAVHQLIISIKNEIEKHE